MNFPGICVKKASWPNYLFRVLMAHFLQFSHCNLNLGPIRRLFMIGRTVFSMSLLAGIFFSNFKLEVGGIGLASNLNALLLVLGGILSTALVPYTWGKILWTFRLLKKAFGPAEDIDWTVRTIVDLAGSYRKKRSVRLLEQRTNYLPPALLKRGVELITYNYSRDQIEQILHQEALNTYNQYGAAHKILQNMARLAAVLGLAGTLIQLIRVFANSISHPDLLRTLGFALLSTFYGLILAGLLFIPLANKLKEFMEQDRLRMEIIQEGILGIYDQEHPRALQYKLEIRSAAMALSHQTYNSPEVVLLAPSERPVEDKIL
jgi:chemotaxis protein MotA